VFSACNNDGPTTPDEALDLQQAMLWSAKSSTNFLACSEALGVEPQLRDWAMAPQRAPRTLFPNEYDEHLR
jgi:hypothetical protein